MNSDPTAVAQVLIHGHDGVEIVPAVGTVYRTSDEAGELTEDLVLVAMTQDQYNRIQGMLVPRNRLDEIVAGEAVEITGDDGEILRYESIGAKLKRLAEGIPMDGLQTRRTE